MYHCPPPPPLEAHVRAAWQTQLASAGTVPGLFSELVRRRPELLPRFAIYYTQLRALPRRVRRALQQQWRLPLAGVALLLALGQSPVQASTIPVGSACTLVDAITAANTDTATGGCPAGSGADTIVLPASSTHILTAVNNSTYGATGLPVITSVITIAGQGSTIMRDSGAPEFRIVALDSSGDLTLQETTVSGGVTPVTFPGGGVANFGGSLTIQNSTITGNSNSAGSYFGGGGGVYNRDGSLTIQTSTITGNTAAYFGGGVFNRDGSLTIQTSTITGNTADFGGGVYSFIYGSLTIQTSTIAGNTAGIYGGGVRNFGGPLTLARTLVAGNTAPTGPEIFNTGTLTAANHNLFGMDGTAGVEGFSPGATDVVPTAGVLLDDILNPTLALNGGLTQTHALIPGSPAIDAGGAVCADANSDPLLTDQRGRPRVVDGEGNGTAACDIGAFEFFPLVNTFVTLDAALDTTFDPTPVPGGPAGTFTITATFTNTSDTPLRFPFFTVTALSGDNLLLNAEEETQGVGATLTPDVGDSVLAPAEAVTVDFVIGLQVQAPFTFLVDLFGEPLL